MSGTRIRLNVAKSSTQIARVPRSVRARFSSAVLGVSAMTNAAAVAADYKQNQFSLVYRGAITKNEPDKVNIHPVTYKLTA